MSQSIHVTHGSTALFEALPAAERDIVILRDTFSYGPLPAIDDFECWLRMRESYWDRLHADVGQRRRRRRAAATPQQADLIGPFRRMAGAAQVVLWLGIGVGDQLALAWLPQLLRAIGGQVSALHVVQFQRSSTGRPITDFAYLSQVEIDRHPPVRPVTSLELAYLDRAWTAVTAPDPSALVQLIDEFETPLPLLRSALTRMLHGYPDARSGVNQHDAQLLASTERAGPRVVYVIVDAITTCASEDGERVGDVWLFWRLLRLADARLPHPAVTLTGGRTLDGTTEARLTEAGERFLSGEWNFVEKNGIDDWVGGVHLDSRAGAVWFRQDATIVRAG